MPAPPLDPRRREFQLRLLTQLRARYPDWALEAAPDGFGVLARKERALVTLTLETLHGSCVQEPAATPALISSFVAAAAPRLAAAEASPDSGAAPDPDALLWCVRLEKVVRSYSRSPELVTRPLPGGLLAFVSEALPGEVMRGVSTAEAGAAGLAPERLAELADRNTSLRLGGWREILNQHPGQRRWLFSEDPLFSSSLVVVPEFLAALAQRGGGEAALLVPDRGMVVGAVGEAASPAQLQHLSRRLYGMARNPLIPQLLATDGTTVVLHPAEAVPRRPWSGWRQVLGLRER